MVPLKSLVLFHILILETASTAKTLFGEDDFCSGNYSNTDGYCLQVFDSQRTTVYFAKRVCERNQGHLVYIDSQHKNEALWKLLRRYTSSRNIDVYIDGRLTGDIQLVNYEGEEMVYANWGRHTPHCVVFNARTGTWALSSCTRYLDFVCEMYW